VKPKHELPGWVQSAEWLSALMTFMGGYFMYSHPSEKGVVIAYRLVLLVTGMGGYLAVQIWKRRSSKRESH